MSAPLLVLILAVVVLGPAAVLAQWVHTTEARTPVHTVSDADLADIRRTRKPKEGQS